MKPTEAQNAALVGCGLMIFTTLAIAVASVLPSVRVKTLGIRI
jgi:hypothetical protein